MSTSQLLCDLISVTAEAPYLYLNRKYIYHEAAATPAQLSFTQVRELIISELCKTSISPSNALQVIITVSR